MGQRAGPAPEPGLRPASRPPQLARAPAPTAAPLIDARPQVAVQRQLQDAADRSAGVARFAHLQLQAAPARPRPKAPPVLQRIRIVKNDDGSYRAAKEGDLKFIDT